MKTGMTDVLVSQTSALALAVRERFGPNCPCCGYPMRVPRGRREKQRYNGRDRQTIAHDWPTGNGGSFKVWVYACHGCNNDQGDMTFWLWARYLLRQGDPRARRVFALADFIRDHRKNRREAQGNADRQP